MGERLVVNFIRNEKAIASAYYHWSAYTMPAINILKAMYDEFLASGIDKTDNDFRLALIRFAEKTTPFGFGSSENEKIKEFIKNAPHFNHHGGLNREEIQLAQELWPNENFLLDENLSRSEGLIQLSPQRIERAEQDAVCIIEVHLDNQMVLFGGVDEYELDEFLYETSDDEDGLLPSDVPEIPLDLGQFSFDDISIVHEILSITDSRWLRFKDSYFHTIEG